MKKITILLLSILVFACSSNDEKNDETENLLIGKWTPEFEKDYSSSNVLLNQYDLSKETCYKMTTYEFKSNNQYIKDSYDYDGKTCVRNTVRTHNYTYVNNVIAINDGESSEVIENTNTLLKLKIVNSDNSYSINEYSKVK